MKKILLVFTLTILILNVLPALAQEPYVLKAGISKIDSVPNQFFGTWSVQSNRVSTDNPKTFATSSIDLWNLRRSGNVIELRNPVTGATAEIYLEDVVNNEITFTHFEKDGNTKLKDTVKLKLNGNTFTGTNELELETLKEDPDKFVRIKKQAVYTIKGTKISGTGINWGVTKWVTKILTL